MAPAKPTSAATPRRPKKTPAADVGKPPAALIDARIAELPDWRGALLARLRALIRAAHPGIVEDWKWNTPVWACHGIVCTGETYNKTVKLTFAQGAWLVDEAGLFNASLAGNARRAIDFQAGAVVDDAALQALVRAAVAFNAAPAGGSGPAGPAPGGGAMADGVVHGACLCTRVRFSARLPSRWVAHCHCSYCRRAHGAAFVTWVGFAAEQFSLDPDSAGPRWYDSSPGAQRAFCPTCGTPMFFQSTRWPGEVHVARALIDAPLDREPSAHVFFERHVPWLTVDDPLPKRTSQG